MPPLFKISTSEAMKLPRTPHRWSVTPKQALQIQLRLAARVRIERPSRRIRLVAGIDVAFSEDGEKCIAGVVIWDIVEKCVLEQQTATRELTFAYVPGLLSFREAPAVLRALRKLKRVPDALLCDGYGLAHPRRFGLACHLGTILDLTAVGCAKSRLVGEHDEPGLFRGAKRRLMHRGEVIGTVLRTRDGVKPVYVSVGNRIDLRTAERIVWLCGAGYRLPEPTRLADRLVAQEKRNARQAAITEEFF